MHTLQHSLFLENLPYTIWQKVSAIDELKGQWIGGAQLNPAVLSRLKKSTLITSTGASTRIEGSQLSDGQIEKLMLGITVSHFANRDQQEVRGYFELLSNVFTSWDYLHFSEGLIKHFHQELLRYVDKDQLHRGEYKHQENQVQLIDAAGHSLGIIFDTTPAYLTPSAMLQLVQDTANTLSAKKFHPLLIIGSFIVQFLRIHPFQDGNGRLSRILTNLLLLQSGYAYMPYTSHEKIIEGNKTEYYLALRQSQKTLRSDEPSIIAWLDFFLDVVLVQSQQAVGILSGENLDKLLSPSQLKVWQNLQVVKEATPLYLSQTLDIPRPTINQIANRLLKLQRIERLGQGRAVRYKVK